ncbi:MULTISPECIES: acylase [unclassified Janthinobacterium]|uniref:acylase n=1 Tax=unclassified Janthinobacterium TaxID=2610881 RepID=UPI00160D8713|nr:MULTISPECIES: acylase [unclassified Janthinobacterium]MBB5368706.1 acyl-homoserine-lactone acylase [Janthinobacterium sp. K2C7]MBB5381758.1 acyl-homoserine-lactone acylase [Janthinobacterium sp. K2Li3]MBB5387088.1 acyl-homoserine-lactone acylase [Janthinobacterium sp. K2E3]
MPARRALFAAIACGVVASAPTLAAAPASATEMARWQAQAANVSIARDTWGVPHVTGKSDADAVFGLMYAQAEDDFPRIERNYINAMGRLAEVEGEQELYRDLRMKLFINPGDLQAQYRASPLWLQKLMTAFADGLNFYLATHPQVKPSLITYFEPWMALSFSEGSIGGDIESVDLAQLESFYGQQARPATVALASAETGLDPEPSGSNGFAIAPAITQNGHALLMINPHTSFYFRPEVQVSSGEGLNAYGAVTWGQFFVYQGFNERLGWMHTSGGGDVIDEYLESIVDKDGAWSYRYDGALRPLKAVPISLPYKLASGGMGTKTITVYYSHHGPIVRAHDGKWVAVRLMNEPLKALTQSYTRTKARDYAAFYKTMELRTNSSNNTVYADADGNIAYFHGNFIPVRDPRFNWKQPVDGSDPATEWKGLHTVAQTITLFNPKNGWIQNTNNWPFSAAGANSPRQQDYPAYMSVYGENARGLHAVKVFQNKTGFTLDSLIAAAYDSELTAFESLLPPLFAAWDALPAGDAQKLALAGKIALLRTWDWRYSLTSTATSLAIFWGQELADIAGRQAREQEVPVVEFMATEQVSAGQRLAALASASDKLQRDFGSWQTPWGQINRFQRLTGEVVQPFDDAKPSLPVPYASGNWGALAAYGQSSKSSTRRIYGERGNSFVAVVEFGPRIKAKSILAGGQSGDPKSPHFSDQAAMYARGQFKDVLFYPEEVDRHLERRYRPGE